VFTIPNSRIDFRNFLVEKTGIEYLYFQPPESIKMSYPAIIYSISRVNHKFADNNKYLRFTAYQLILIDKDPDSEFFYKLLDLPMCSYTGTSYQKDNLNHYIFTIYY